MGLKRRSFLRRSGLALAALGAGDLMGLVPGWQRSYEVLAKPTSRKLALLVGINQYSPEVYDRSVAKAALSGCLTDVEMQKDLLCSRFGFAPTDVLTLTNQQATRANIEAAFLSHLTDQARPGDVVVFHFSGYGGQVRPVESSAEAIAPAEGSDDGLDGRLQMSLVPYDGLLPAAASPVVNDLTEETLLLLLRSLSTQQVVTVLDTGYRAHTSGLLGNFRVRARSQVIQGSLSPEAIAFQDSLLTQLKSSRDQTRVRRLFGQLPGVVLSAASPPTAVSNGPLSARPLNQAIAFEGQWDGFSAGLFTYALTQRLWWSTPATTLQVSLAHTAETLEHWLGQTPPLQISGQQDRTVAPLPYGPPQPATGADGVVVAVEEDAKAGQVWLGGVPGAVIEHYGVGSLFSLVSEEPTDALTPLPAKSQLLQVQSRSGLKAKVRRLEARSDQLLQTGQMIQETVRVLPRQLSLVVAMDANLERIERVDATSAFSAMPHTTSVNAGEQPADCLFGCLAPPSGSNKETARLGATPAGGYGLLSLGRVPIPGTVGEGGEAVKTAVQRLRPHLRSLLAAKLLRMTCNEGSSRLGVQASLEIVTPGPQLLATRTPRRSPWPLPPAKTLPEAGPAMPVVAAGSRLQFRILNFSDRPVHYLLLGLDSSGSPLALYSPFVPLDPSDGQPRRTLNDDQIAPGETIVLPQPTGKFEWIIDGPVGVAQTYLVCSRQPFTQTLMVLEGRMRSRGDLQRFDTPDNPLEIAQALLEDLHQASVSTAEGLGVETDGYALDVNQWATLGFVYQVV